MLLKLVVVLFVLLPFCAHAEKAQPQTPPEEKVEKPVVIPPPPPVETNRNSEQNREGKTYQANALLTGSGPSSGSTSGLQFGYFLKPNDILMLEYTTATSSTNYTSSVSGVVVSQSDTKITYNSLGIHYKYFSSNSFYVRGGLDFMKGHLNNNYVSNYGSSSYSFDAHVLSVMFNIGNQWQWDNFTLGCDWVGATSPILTRFSDERINSNYSSERGLMEGDQSNYFSHLKINLLRFFLGASW